MGPRHRGKPTLAVLSFAILVEYFPKKLAGRANAHGAKL
jgi:hypothetical protein